MRVVLPKPAGAQISVIRASLCSIRAIRGVRSTAPWGPLGGENRAAWGPFAELVLVRVGDTGRSSWDPARRFADGAAPARGCQFPANRTLPRPFEGELASDPCRSDSRNSVIFWPIGCG